MQVCQVNYCYYFRTIVYWRSKDVDNILKGYKLNLQSAIGSKAPASILNFYFKYTFCRKVCRSEVSLCSEVSCRHAGTFFTSAIIQPEV